ncbi:hypothetical protein D3C87_588340 [compost metagenome]
MYSHRILDAFDNDTPVDMIRKLLRRQKERDFFWDQLEHEQRIYARVVQVIMVRMAEFRYTGTLRKYYRAFSA